MFLNSLCGQHDIVKINYNLCFSNEFVENVLYESAKKRRTGEIFCQLSINYSHQVGDNYHLS